MLKWTNRNGNTHVKGLQTKQKKKKTPNEQEMMTKTHKIDRHFCGWKERDRESRCLSFLFARMEEKYQRQVVHDIKIIDANVENEEEEEDNDEEKRVQRSIQANNVIRCFVYYCCCFFSQYFGSSFSHMHTHTLTHKHSV